MPKIPLTLGVWYSVGRPVSRSGNKNVGGSAYAFVSEMSFVRFLENGIHKVASHFI